MSSCAISSPDWYKCPIPISIFCIFAFIFVYSVVVLIRCSNMITSNTQSQNMKEIFTVYIINIVVTFLSLMVILFFLYKIIPPDWEDGIFNDAVGMIFMFYILIVSSWTLHLFNHIEGIEKKEIQIFAGIAIGLSCVALVLYGSKHALAAKYGTKADFGQIAKQYAKTAKKPAAK